MFFRYSDIPTLLSFWTINCQLAVLKAFCTSKVTGTCHALSLIWTTSRTSSVTHSVELRLRNTILAFYKSKFLFSFSSFKNSVILLIVYIGLYELLSRLFLLF